MKVSNFLGLFYVVQVMIRNIANIKHSSFKSPIQAQYFFMIRTKLISDFLTLSLSSTVHSFFSHLHKYLRVINIEK